MADRGAVTPLKRQTLGLKAWRAFTAPLATSSICSCTPSLPFAHLPLLNEAQHRAVKCIQLLQFLRNQLPIRAGADEIATCMQHMMMFTSSMEKQNNTPIGMALAFAAK